MTTPGAPPAPGLRDRKKRQTRAALAEAALRLVAERGLDQVTVEEISAAADVSARTFFNYFASKDEALVGDPAGGGVRLVARVAAAPPGQPVLTTLRHALDEVIDEIRADRELWSLRMEVVTRNPALLPRLIAGNAATEQAIVDVLAARLGVGPDHPYPRLVTAVAGAALRAAMTRWATHRDDRDLADLVDEAFAALAAGLPEPGPAR
ncbi:TetR family transcriptional regulator [Micromonospora sp. NBC_01655]|uniref:acyl-CoA-like ligand-binding transcription factor n=1 Tax=Micromonospora sp. NBC_01655 TaxID=2975983 RepID=UPI0022561B54|nr:TetR family transcriptional regulator [Micromonospora sp. NBC_01655]MCX4472467.1 TetR family transcriptional regulator [Micromonospora sp. NBC_01655]